MVNLLLYDARHVEQLATERLANVTGLRVEHLAASAEAVPLESGVGDTVLATWALCTIPRPSEPGGRRLFAEHGEAADEDVRRCLPPRSQATARAFAPPLRSGCGGGGGDRR